MEKLYVIKQSSSHGDCYIATTQADHWLGAIKPEFCYKTLKKAAQYAAKLSGYSAIYGYHYSILEITGDIITHEYSWQDICEILGYC